ncbi:Protein of unknown function DUF3536 [Desulfovibrio sp. X2]|uniref:DUF3536 domain-containing protein n=1 Tax=Desulfovibrio sp. X2 TaxID=941449 RepID=UPI000358C1D3|nr:DUF3536 domain-containing protein [Desulfovibrio sp. X2]EPR44764.1 Protein of unknown function DUF3536 [Desulfovibrio sp. X2]
MDKYLCFHGHFYQPPREDPWLDTILPEGSAAPALHWNARIARESYAPLAWARRLDGAGRIGDLLNCYEWMSFNFGPTLMRWLEGHDPAAYGRIIEADRRSVERLGHGNAMAQICHHVIMPLASPLDRELEVAWGIQDFERRFGRRPEGMWLSEAAADTDTLEELAANGIAFTVLSPAQIKAVASLENDDWREVREWEVDITHPYRIELPSGRSIAVFFYHGPLSQAVAFQGLLADGERFWQRMTENPSSGLRAIGTDGETYGHHFHFGEMALAYVLEQARSGRDGWRLTNFAAFLAEHPPRLRARLHEPSSWSCAHGVERWRSDCGCTTGDHPGYHQKWRAPLRAALNVAREAADNHFFSRGPECFGDPRKALREYGRVAAGGLTEAEFEAGFFKPGITQAGRELGWRLLDMQWQTISSFASCAWFFDELSRIEPLNAMTMALRSMELVRATGGPDVAPRVVAELHKAPSNLPELGTGADLWRTQVVLRQETPARLAAQGLIRLWARQGLPDPGEIAEVAWPGLSLVFTLDPSLEPGEPLSGSMTVAWRLRSERPLYRWRMVPDEQRNPLSCLFEVAPEGDAKSVESCLPGRDLPWNKRQALAVEWIEHAERSVWQETVLEAVSGSRLFMPWQEAQTDQPLSGRWMIHLPALGWAWCLGLPAGDEGEADMGRYLAARLPGHPGAQALKERLASEMARLIKEEETPLEAVSMLSRARAVGLSPDLWPVQNALWAMRGRLAPGTVAEVAAAFGFMAGVL